MAKDVIEVMIPVGAVTLPGDLRVPPAPCGLVVFAHGSGSSRSSTRNRFVAEVLDEAPLATLLFDLLTAEEHERDQVTRHLRFDIPLLADRLTAAVEWVVSPESPARASSQPLGLFGASTGAAAALMAAARRPDLVAAVVSRGGRPDLAGSDLPRVQAPTLLIVGGNDGPVIDLNRQAGSLLTARKRIEIVSGASHLFEEPGTLERAAALARDWFVGAFSAASRRDR